MTASISWAVLASANSATSRGSCPQKLANPGFLLLAGVAALDQSHHPLVESLGGFLSPWDCTSSYNNAALG